MSTQERSALFDAQQPACGASFLWTDTNNGKLVLSRVEVEAAPLTAPHRMRPVALAAAASPARRTQPHSLTARC